MTNINTASRTELEIVNLENDLENILFDGIDSVMSADTDKIRQKLIEWIIEGNEATC